MEVDSSRSTSEYTNAIDIWALGCITHEILTRVLPLQGWNELSSYCSRPELPRNTMASKNISKSGIKFVERALAYPPEHRITAREALDLEWLRPGLGTEEDWTGPASPGHQLLEAGPLMGILTPQSTWEFPGTEGGRTGLAFDQEVRLRMGIPTPPLSSPPSFITYNPPKEQPPIAPTTFLGPPMSVTPLLPWCIVAVRPVTALLTFKSPYANAIGRTISLIQWGCTLCKTLVVNRYFLAVAIFSVWSLFFWGLISPLLVAIGIQSVTIKIVLFAIATCYIGRGIYALVLFRIV